MKLRSLFLAAILLAGSILSAAPITFYANLDGPSEAPPQASPGTGFAFVTLDNVAHTLRVQVTFSNLLGTTMASHIHSATAVPFTGTAGVATTVPTFSGFPLGVTSGTYDNTFDLTLASSYNPAFVTASGSIAAAEAALLAGSLAGKAYFNIHSSFASGGEIRGFLIQTPEPATLGFVGLALAGFLALGRKRRLSA